MSVECRLQLRCKINEKEPVIDEMVVAAFSEKHLADRSISRRKTIDMRQSLRLRIDRSVQPESFVVDPDRSLISYDVIRIGVIKRLEICLLHPVVNSRATAMDVGRFRNRYSVSKS